MNLKTYRAASVADALQQIKKDLGPDAVILHTRTTRQGGFFGFGGRSLVEITASCSTSVKVMDPLARKSGRHASAGPSTPRARAAMLQRAYAGSAIADAKEGASPSSPPAQDHFEASTREPNEPGVGRGDAEQSIADDSTDVQDSLENLPKIESVVKPVQGPSSGVGVGAPALDVTAPPQTGAAGVGEHLNADLAAIKRMVGQVLQRSSSSPQPGMPEALFQQYLRMIEGEVAMEIADQIVASVRDELTRDELADEAVVQQAVLRRLESHIPVCASASKAGRMADGRPLTIALVGPTGVGKTTTIAKLAATYKLRQGRKVGLITSDTYRIAAVDQLRTYASIIGLPLQVALSPREMSAACESLADCDVILIDTAGRSQHDTSRLEELQGFLRAARPHETHLVLSSVCSQSTMLRAAERFSVVEPNRIIFTKLDEAVSFGTLVNAAQSIDARLSFVTTGQEVPDHIEPGRADRLARMVLDGVAAAS